MGLGVRVRVKVGVRVLIRGQEHPRALRRHAQRLGRGKVLRIEAQDLLHVYMCICMPLTDYGVIYMYMCLRE